MKSRERDGRPRGERLGSVRGGDRTDAVDEITALRGVGQQPAANVDARRVAADPVRQVGVERVPDLGRPLVARQGEERRVLFGFHARGRGEHAADLRHLAESCQVFDVVGERGLGLGRDSIDLQVSVGPRHGDPSRVRLAAGELVGDRHEGGARRRVGKVLQVLTGRELDTEEGRTGQQQQRKHRHGDEDRAPHDASGDPRPEASALAGLGDVRIVLGEAQRSGQRNAETVHAGSEHREDRRQDGQAEDQRRRDHDDAAHPHAPESGGLEDGE